MTDQDGLPPLPWWQGRDARRAARAERRRERHDAREEKRAVREADKREPVTPERLGEAALRVIDAEGLEALTVRRLAQELGVGTMTLYWYVSNKEEVLDLVADRILADVAIAADAPDWRAGARDAAASVRSTFLRHRNAVPVLMARPSLGRNGLRVIEEAIELFQRAGFGLNDAADAYFTISNYVTGFVAFETAAVSTPGNRDIDRRGYGQLIRNYIQSLPADRYPGLLAAAPRIFGGSLDERFAYGLSCLIDGLAARLAAMTTGEGTAQDAGTGA